jgi:Integrase core domain
VHPLDLLGQHPVPSRPDGLGTFLGRVVTGRAGAVKGYLLDNRRPEAGQRFAALAELFDPWTFRHLDAVGLGQGWRCWEVGAGGVSVPHGLAERVGTSGRVLATDIDTSWLAPAAGGALEIRRHDITRDPPPAETFDLVHTRLVLVHRGRGRRGRPTRAITSPTWVDRDFTAEAPGTKLVGDITYIPTGEGWVYLPTAIDCYSKMVIGWSMADHYRPG